jgi:hypothetical protein
VRITIVTSLTHDSYLTGTKDAGINRVLWNLSAAPAAGAGGFGGGGGGGGGPAAVAPGMYKVTLQVGSLTLSKTVEVLEDRWIEER